MIKPSHYANPCWLGFVLAAFVAAPVILFGAGTASATTASAPQTRVGAHTLVVQVLVGPQRGIGAGQRLGNDPPAYDSSLATGVAAETGGGRLAGLRATMADDTGAIGPGVGDLKFARKVGLPADSPLVANRELTVNEFISKFRKSGIRGEIPGEYLDQSVEDALRAGDSTLRKLLTSSRWTK